VELWALPPVYAITVPRGIFLISRLENLLTN